MSTSPTKYTVPRGYVYLGLVLAVPMTALLTYWFIAWAHGAGDLLLFVGLMVFFWFFPVALATFSIRLTENAVVQSSLFGRKTMAYREIRSVVVDAATRGPQVVLTLESGDDVPLDSTMSRHKELADNISKRLRPTRDLESSPARPATVRTRTTGGARFFGVVGAALGAGMIVSALTGVLGVTPMAALSVFMGAVCLREANDILASVTIDATSLTVRRPIASRTIRFSDLGAVDREKKKPTYRLRTRDGSAVKVTPGVFQLERKLRVTLQERVEQAGLKWPSR